MFKNSWLFPIVQSIHLIGIALLVGNVVVTNFRTLGLQLRLIPAPWPKLGLAVMFTTGPILFAADIARYTTNPAFLFKMIVLAVALALRNTQTKLAAILSIILWSCVVLGGRAIADFDV